ncbi:MAG TPA: sensor histidine kinase [Hungateiclostridium thermocellum]|uniref:histidine kinase n=1 Tax=Acetivibrio thermocellus (strain ATCC 27405 / DSM 1237 / JCM 9322 / NBRC 103400 / NCIMB 10682 / NRRL B-4536 / VPI 7372) TaxID=203119 RepID=A3DGQ5_ACET2|nr:HAMP domain-containing sensor histidine kinase [Acetivibrio thermocellus]CDG36431.1 periplasmic sensor signal transduction histidine kinase [Acetivibrio thermocellus BC1]ABN53134.1 integral membrane sensor signal transduction histidine kinase [Acetivibrio thermocellus ATCC 27405]NLU26501.1 HAMP domain-containing histidine kinase [Acetivibrio thermocellus]HBW27095.1 sensor histidine kinase [Acetivibrio thermocellus]HOP93312.1 HAMP domain-containing sensor histidine kinase [Acetivibrio thermo
MRGIRGRVVGTYLIITFLSVVIFEIILIYGLVEFYYSSIEAELSRSAQSIIHNYSQYFNNYDLHRDAKVLLESMPGNTVAQVQIIDDKGVLIADSIEPSMEGKKLDNYDVNMALNGKEAAWKGKIPMTGEPVFSVSFPIIRPDSEEVIGIVRVITTLSDVNEILKNHIIILISLGLCIVFLIFLTGLALTNTIIKPVKEITSAAKAMAQGRFDVRVSKRYDDEIGELGDTLNYMAQEVANQQKMKNDFIASISHELRTPLTSIMGWIITINSGDIDSKEELKEGLDIIERESKRLAELVDELLDFSKFDAGIITLRKSVVNLGELLKYIKRQMEPRAERKGITMTIDVDEHLPLIEADENRLKQVFINIIDNSFKFTQKGGYIDIIGRKNENGVLIRIEDSGCGIPEEDLPRVKQRFFKGSNVVSGSGLGLAICDEIVRLHNGKIDIESTVGKGTRVDVILPV